MRLPEPTKLCEACGGVFGRHPRKTGKLEAHTIFARRRFCSQSCANGARIPPLDIDKRGIESLHDILHYDPETGAWTWRVRRTMRIRAGDVAGSLSNGGHRQIEIGGRAYLSSRLAWLYVTGEWPPRIVDHIDPNRPGDDRWTNLRLATSQQNARNRRKRSDSTSGYKGVSYRKDNRTAPWRAYIWIDGENISLGFFPTAEEAHAAYCEAAREFFGEFFNPG